MIPGFRLFVQVRARKAGSEGRAFWNEVSTLPLDEAESQVLNRVDTARRRLENDSKTVERIDFGAGTRRLHNARRGSVSIGELATKASISRSWGWLLFKVARVARSHSILELGSCVGISTAYLQSALDLNGGGIMVSMEGDPNLCTVARSTLRAVSSAPGDIIEGRFDDILPSTLEKHEGFDLVFIDGHHDPLAVGRYLDMISPHFRDGAIVILDDVQPLTGAVRPAWKTIIQKVSPIWHVDLIRMGVFRIGETQ